jgi:signal peptidase I
MTDSQAGPGKHARPKKRVHPLWRGIREIVVIVVVALVLSALIRAFLAQAFYVPSASMEDTLQPGDRIIASKITTDISGVKRGEIVVFKDPGDWLPAPVPPPANWRTTVREALTFIGVLPSDAGDDLVKRVIGIGGDRVACCDADGRIVLNGVPLEEDYIIGPTDQVRFDVSVPADGMFVMGDNRSDSRDSRFHLEDADGAVPVDNAVGRVFLVMWPFDRLAIETIPSIFGNPAVDVQLSD